MWVGEDKLSQFIVEHQKYYYASFEALEQSLGKPVIAKLPYCLRIVLENLLRHEDNETVCREDIIACANWPALPLNECVVAYHPARVLMQDLTGVPAIVDLSAMRDAIKRLGGRPAQINPFSPVDLIVDHSIQVDSFGTAQALHENTLREMQRNKERYAFLRWGQETLDHFRVVPPEKGICHQVNIEYLSQPICFRECNGLKIAYPDTLVGTDSHTTMINGLGVLGWGVGGIEAEAAMLGQPISLSLPKVIGVELVGALQEGVTATDLVLTLTEVLRKKGVVGQFVEYIGSGIAALSVADRATISNMAPEYGATCGFFPIDQATIDYLQITGRNSHHIALAEQYAKHQSLWYEVSYELPQYTQRMTIDLSTITPSLAGPGRPQDRVSFSQLPQAFKQLLVASKRHAEYVRSSLNQDQHAISLNHGDVVIAAITSCTNTSNPAVMIAAGLLAKKALEKGLKSQPWVKTSLAPGSLVVTKYLQQSGLQSYLDRLGFFLVGYGCTTCIGNSGPLPVKIDQMIADQDLIVCSVLSGNRNFAGRIHPSVRANWLASPPLVVVFALTGTINIDLSRDPIGQDSDGRAVYLRDIWPTTAEIMVVVNTIQSDWFKQQYAGVFEGTLEWETLSVPQGQTYAWQEDSTYIRCPPFFSELSLTPLPVQNINHARILVLLGDSITTDHISPAGSIKPDSPAGYYLLSKGVTVDNFNSYGARRGNHEVMVRGTFANVRLCNEMVQPLEGGMTRYYPSKEVLTIYDAAIRYQQEQIPLVIIAGKEYGMGSSRDWAAKGPKLLGVIAVIAESFERIHRSNLIGMGILPLQFPSGINRQTLGLDGSETISIASAAFLSPKATVTMTVENQLGSTAHVDCLCRIDTQNEMAYYEHGGILNYVLRKTLKSA